ncbi:HAMP domain-containing sensor histidine kinase [Phenylobacterium sp. LjRoot225]|uniref:HAMP domain-containing sensor histidine kinase n=1 Tax=Phenylobacterium sp. LjRoot225 TaxID=3342285 RepID=UPI003ECCD9B4
MIRRVKEIAKRYWPALRLRTIVFSVLLFAAAMPGVSAIFLRVYENTLVRQTEAELVAQGAALAAMASVNWPGATPDPTPIPNPNLRSPGYYRPENTTIDLSRSPVLPERPAATKARQPPDPAATAAAARLAPVIAQTSRTTLASILVLDARGRVVRGPGLGGDLSALPEVRTALSGEPRTVLRRNGDYHPEYSFEWLSRASALRLHHARPIEAGGRVVGALLLSRSPRALFRGLYEDRGKIALGVVAILGMLIVLSGLVSRGVTRPIEALSAASRDVAAGTGSVPPTPRTGALEIRALYEDFRVMAERIDRRSGYLRDFAAAVSHEFKTPLAGISGAVELLQDHFDTMSGDERRRFLDNIAADSQRLSHLVTRLLDLARADLAAPEAGAAAEIGQPLRKAADAIAGPDFTVEFDLPQDPVQAAVPAVTLETVLTVLLQNSRQAGARRVLIAARRAQDGIVIQISDDGPGVALGDRDRLFEPFFTSRRAEGGTGLGLPIARSLLAASAGRLDLAPSSHGALFEIRLPLP